MTDVTLLEKEQSSGTTSYVSSLLDKMEKILHDHRQKDPDLYRLVDEKKLIQAAKQANVAKEKPVVLDSICGLTQEPFYFKQYQQKQLKQKIATNQNLIHEQVLATEAMVEPRTKARNEKQCYVSIEAMKMDRKNKSMAMPYLQLNRY